VRNYEFHRRRVRTNSTKKIELEEDMEEAEEAEVAEETSEVAEETSEEVEEKMEEAEETTEEVEENKEEAEETEKEAEEGILEFPINQEIRSGRENRTPQPNSNDSQKN